MFGFCFQKLLKCNILLMCIKYLGSYEKKLFTYAVCTFYGKLIHSNHQTFSWILNSSGSLQICSPCLQGCTLGETLTADNILGKPNPRHSTQIKAGWELFSSLLILQFGFLHQLYTCWKPFVALHKNQSRWVLQLVDDRVQFSTLKKIHKIWR